MITINIGTMGENNNVPKNFKDNDVPKNFKNLWQVYFNFYFNKTEEIESFKKEIKKLFPFIVGFKKSDNYSHYRLLVFFNTQEECEKIQKH